MKLLFVYNASAGLVAGMMDSIHKFVSPQTYACDLCAITYGPFRMQPEWRDWLSRQSFEAVFHHRPDFRQAYPGTDVLLPAILIDEHGTLRELVAATDFHALSSVSDLIALIEKRLAAASP